MDNKNAINQRAINQKAISQKNVQKTAALNCMFTRVIRNSRPALLARISVPVVSRALIDSNSLETLLDHATNLNVRLPTLKVSVKTSNWVNPDDLLGESVSSPYIFVLHGLFGKQMTSQNLSGFLDLLTQDFNTFVAYTQAHNIGILSVKDQTLSTSILA